MDQMETVKGIYLGDRGEDFKRLITSLLKKGNLKQKYIDLLTTPENMEKYGAAFTSELVDETNNYQVYEQLGDLTGNKFIVWYFYKRFPQLKCAEGVKVAARLRINYGSKNSFFKIAQDNGFWPFISATNQVRQRKVKSLLEDVLEAFIGVTESILDEEVRLGVGYASAYSILESMFDEMNISLRYKDLYDAKTRLKEMADMFGEKLGPIIYDDRKDGLLNYSTIYRLVGVRYETNPDGSTNLKKFVGKYTKVKIGEGNSALKPDSQQIASANALETLAKQGFIKHDPSIYAKFEKNLPPTETTEADVLRIISSKSNIHDVFDTRGKSKHQYKYQSTALAMYSRKRDLKGIEICLAWKGNPNQLDSEGLSCLDLALIGVYKPKLVYKIVSRFFKAKENLILHQNIFKIYYSKYETEYSWFTDMIPNLVLLKDEIIPELAGGFGEYDD